MAKTTHIELRGDRDKAKTLTLAHAERLLLNFRSNTSFQNLKINANVTNFFDDTGRIVGTIYMQVVNGAENIVVTVPIVKIPVEKREEELWLPETELTQFIVPCFIVTDEDSFSEKVIGYIASTGGTWTGPYRFFPNNDTDIVMESFYNEGQEEYDADLALENRRLLANEGDAGSLYFFKPSGTVPAEERATEGAASGGVTTDHSCGGISFVDGSDATYLWSNAISEDTISTSGSPYGWDLLFDGITVGRKYEQYANTYGTYLVSRGWTSCTPVGAECAAAMAAFRTNEDVFASDCEYAFGTTISFDRYSDTETEGEIFLDDYLDWSIRLNGSIDSSVYLTERWEQTSSSHSWNHRPLPNPYAAVFGSLPCDGCTDTNNQWKNELLISVDAGEKISVSAAFEWGDWYKFSGVYGAGVVYHKSEGSDNSISLATVLAGPTNEGGSGYFSEMAFIYAGSAANDLEGSVSFPLQNPEGSTDRYCLIEGLEQASDGTERRIRGQIFLGTIYTEEDKLNCIVPKHTV